MKATTTIRARQERKRMCPLVSCVTIGPAHDTEYFDVRANEFSAGQIDGARAALEVLYQCRADMEASLLLRVLGRTNELMRQTTACPVGDRRGAAVGFHWVIDQLLMFAIENIGLDDFAAKELREHEKLLKDELKTLQGENASFLAKLAANDAQEVAA